MHADPACCSAAVPMRVSDLMGAFSLGLQFAHGDPDTGRAVLAVVYGEHPTLLAEYRAGVAWRSRSEPPK